MPTKRTTKQTRYDEVCVRLSAAALIDLVEMINENTDHMFETAESFERPSQAVRRPANVKINAAPDPDDDDDDDDVQVPMPEDDEMPTLDRRSKASMVNWLIAAVPDFADRYPSWTAPKLKRYIGRVISETNRFNDDGVLLS